MSESNYSKGILRNDGHVVLWVRRICIADAFLASKELMKAVASTMENVVVLFFNKAIRKAAKDPLSSPWKSRFLATRATGTMNSLNFALCDTPDPLAKHYLKLLSS